MEIIDPTKQQLAPDALGDTLVAISDSRGRIYPEGTRFNRELTREEAKAHKKNLPFASRPARDYYSENTQAQKDKQMKMNGFVNKALLIKPKMDWKIYSDLKNFEIIEDKEVQDKWLTQSNPGLRVLAKSIVYKFKGYKQKYRMMEDGPSSIKRAQDKAKKLVEPTPVVIKK